MERTGDVTVQGTLASLLVPGVGPALARRRAAALAWAIAGAVTLVGALWTVWAVYVTLLIRIAAMVDAYLRLRRLGERPSWTGWATIAVLVIAIPGFLAGSFGLHAYEVPSSGMEPTLEVGDHIFADTLSPWWHAPARGDIVVFRHPCSPDRDYIKRVIALAGDTVEVRCNTVYVNGKAVPSTLVDGDHCSYDDRDDMQGRWDTRRCSRYREAIDGHSYDIFHDPDRPARDRARAAGGPARPDDRDFPTLGNTTPPTCAGEPQLGAAPPPIPAGKIVAGGPAADACAPQLHYVVPPGQVFVLGDNRNNSNDSRYWGGVPTSMIRGTVIGIWHSEGPHGERWGRIGGVH